MILKNKKLLIITSLLTLLPIPLGLLLWNRFPETMAIHFGITGQADSYASPSYAVFMPPLTMLGVQWLCILATTFDKSNKSRNQKIQKLVLWIIPMLSILISCSIYALALGWEFSPIVWTMLPMGILFAAIGNYMPKTRMNSTIGIKVWWTYTSEENWNATHRFAGKVWVIGGILIALCSLLPYKWAVAVMLPMFLVLPLLPILYSRQYYKKELAAGKELSTPKKNTSKKARLFSTVMLILLTVFVCVMMFTGSIRYDFQEDYLFVDTNLYSDYIVHYDTIDAVQFREGNVPGLRVGGFGSLRLLMGWYENEEFGTYIRYTYYKPEACVLLIKGDHTIVLSGENREETQQLYQQLCRRTGK